MRTANAPEVRFNPPRVEGLADVNEVAVYADRLEVHAGDQWLTYRFSDFAKRQEPLIMNLLKRLMGRRPLPLLVGSREFCTERRYVSFDTQTPLKIYTPPDLDRAYALTYIFRINSVLRSGGFDTRDLS